MSTHRFHDQYDSNCYLVVDLLLDGSASIHGWNDNADAFTGIDLSPSDVALLTGMLVSRPVVTA